ncbi:PQQ-binding-like beta-propeller repeat protein [Cellulomonas soli]|uniref:outer membrane protein assembly factor BamB family protein n=1 Tax=Cellulomonas soli TaxID=931535 RepID=UPI003F839FA0
MRQSPMQQVPVEEAEGVVDPGLRERSGPERLRALLAGVRRRFGGSPRRSAIALLVVVVVLVGAVLGVPAAVTAWERHGVLRAAPFEGGVHALPGAPAVRWMATYDEQMTPVLVGDVIVVAGWSRGRRALAGLDVVSGERRWTLPLEARREGSDLLCTALPEDGAGRAAERSVVCSVGAARGAGDLGQPESGLSPADPGARSTVLVVDPRDGEVRAALGVDGQVVALIALGQDVVLGRVGAAGVLVERRDPMTGERRWSTVLREPSLTGVVRAMRVAASVPRVLVRGVGATRVLDARTGEPVPSESAGAGADVVRLRPDGTLEWIRYRLAVGGIEVTSTLVEPEGGRQVTVQGVLVDVPVSDGASGLMFSASMLAADPAGGRVRAFDAVTGAQVWRAPVDTSTVDADVAGVVVLRASGTFVGVRAGTGELVWRSPIGLGLVGTFSDGDRLLVLRRTVRFGAVLEARRLSDGERVWQMALPPRVDGVLRLGGLLYGTGDGLLVALR